jgi:hypothetical protein
LGGAVWDAALSAAPPLDPYLRKPGFYTSARRIEGTNHWVCPALSSLPAPDQRTGFPFVKLQTKPL